jgi:hypothetical protein
MKIKLSKSQWEGIGKKAGWMKRAQYQSKCYGCKKVLTDEKGRYHEGIVDSNYPLPPPTKTETENITWMWCNDCYNKLKTKEN